jgi:hypothetical protein
MFVEEKREGEAQVAQDEWRQLLLRAADLIENRGWCQHVFENPPWGGVCALGALNRAGTGPDYTMARTKLERHINNFSIPCWNDKRGQTKEKVLAAFRGAARS